MKDATVLKLGAGLAAAIVIARRWRKEKRIAPENVVELAQGTSTEPLAYGTREQVAPLLLEYSEYLADQGVRLEWFTIDELTKLRRTGRYAVPPRHLWDEMARTILAVAQPIREEFGAPVVIYNGYRPRWYNELVKGAPQSLHLRNAALDMIAAQASERTRLAQIAARFMRAHGDERRIGMGIYHYPRMTGLHVDALVRDRATPYSETRRWMRSVA